MKCTIAATFATLLLAGFIAAQQPDYSKVEIKPIKLSNSLYALEGQGGVMGALTGPDGVFMVDTQFAPLSSKIFDAVKKLSNGQPIKFVVNTHVHGDHTGGDENFAKAGAILLSRDELRYRLAHPAPGANGQPTPPPAAIGLPMITYRGPVTFHMDGEDIELIPIPAAHTDGDTIVRFVHNDVIFCGDYFRSIQYPNIDRANGGSLKGMLDGLAFLIGQAGPNTKIVPGHGPIVDRNAVEAHRDMIIAIRDKVAPLVAQGKTLDEVIAAKPTADYDSKVQEVGTTAQRFVGQLYAELKAQ
jgi:glyoxylase-like metal-dependent hydrolase (beta-lactamase superfamily II)